MKTKGIISDFVLDILVAVVLSLSLCKTYELHLEHVKIKEAATMTALKR